MNPSTDTTQVQKADVLISGAHVITFDEAGSIPDGAIVIVDGVIAEVGPRTEVTPRWHADRTIDASGKIAMPGLTDAHMHTAQTLMRGILTTLKQSGALREPPWVHYLAPFEGALTPEDVYLSGELAYSTMLRSGTTTFFEAGGPHPEAMVQAAVESGIRGIVSLSTMDIGGGMPDSMVMGTDEALARNIELVERFPAAADGSTRVSACMSLRQIVACTPELITGIHAEARARGVKVHTHLAEGTYEIDYALERFGKRPVDYLISQGVFTDTLHGAHSVMIDTADIHKYVTHGVSTAHCAKGNYSIGTPLAVRMWRSGVNIGLGTDGVVQSGTLDLFRVAMIAFVGQQYIEGTSVHNRWGVDHSEPMSMAVLGGPRAMGLSAHIGSLTLGKQADLLLLRTDGPNAAAYASPEAFLYECAGGSDVETVFVAGTEVVSDGEVRTVETARVHRDASRRQGELFRAVSA